MSKYFLCGTPITFGNEKQIALIKRFDKLKTRKKNLKKILLRKGLGLYSFENVASEEYSEFLFVKKQIKKIMKHEVKIIK